MRKLIMKVSVSADGFMAGANGEIDWIFKTGSPDAIQWIADIIDTAGVHIMGSKTFHDMANYWPTSTEPLAEPMNRLPKVVFSRNAGMTTDTDPSKTTMALKQSNELKKQMKLTETQSPYSATWKEAK